jgi:hypothetical protein
MDAAAVVEQPKSADLPQEPEDNTTLAPAQQAAAKARDKMDYPNRLRYLINNLPSLQAVGSGFLLARCRARFAATTTSPLQTDAL